MEELLPLVEDVLASAREGIIIFDVGGDVSYATAFAKKVLGIVESDGHSHIGATVRTIDGDDVKSLTQYAGTFPITLRVSGAGDERLLRVTGRNGHRSYLIQDVSEEMHSTDVERDLLDVVAHDLRAGLVPVKTYAQMLASGVLGTMTEKQGDALKAIDRCVQKQVEKISSVLDMVKGQQNRLDIQLEPVNLGEIISHVIEGAERDTKRRNITLVRDIETGTAILEGDMFRLERILGNLMARAIKQTPHGGSVGLELRFLRGGRARLRLWDTGAGGGRHEVELLTTSGRDQAAGRLKEKKMPDIDLSSICDIVTAHHGELKVHTEEGAGTTYTLYLPVRRRAQTGTTLAPEPKRLLLAGLTLADVAQAREKLDPTIEIHEAATGRLAILAARQRHFDFVVVGEGITDVTQERVLTAIRTQRPEQPQVIGRAVEAGGTGESPLRRIPLTELRANPNAVIQSMTTELSSEAGA